MKQITTDEFAGEVLQSDKPVLVDFYTERCGPCKMMAPILTEVADEHSDRFKTVKVNAGSDGPLAAEFGVQVVPTFMIFQNGGPVAQRAGTVAKQDLVAWIDQTIAAN